MLKKLDQLSAATAIRILYIVMSFMLIAHWLACLWWLIGMFEFHQVRTLPKGGSLRYPP